MKMQYQDDFSAVAHLRRVFLLVHLQLLLSCASSWFSAKSSWPLPCATPSWRYLTIMKGVPERLIVWAILLTSKVSFLPLLLTIRMLRARPDPLRLLPLLLFIRTLDDFDFRALRLSPLNPVLLSLLMVAQPAIVHRLVGRISSTSLYLFLRVTMLTSAATAILAWFTFSPSLLQAA